MELELAEVDVAVGGGIGREDREDDLLVVVAGQRADEKDVGVLFVPGGDVDTLGFFLEFVSQTISRSEFETVGKHHNGTDVQAGGRAVASDLLNAGVVGNFDLNLEHLIGENRLR